MSSHPHPAERRSGGWLRRLAVGLLGLGITLAGALLGAASGSELASGLAGPPRPTLTLGPEPSLLAPATPTATPTPPASPTPTVVAAPASSPTPTLVPTPTPRPAPWATPPARPATPTPSAPAWPAISRPAYGGAAVIRAAPTTAAEAVGAIPLGETVEVLGIVQGEAIDPAEPRWFRVRYRGTEGFVYGKLLKSR